MSKNIKVILIMAGLVILSIVYHIKYLNEFPSHIHAWAQSDRYALSLGFLDNGLNFFQPQTFVYNHQFPDNYKFPSENTITAVDFPLHDYIPALLMKFLGITSPWVFRVYILLYSLLGLFFLFKLSYAITQDYFKSVFVLIFAATSPVYVYYQGGFLPTVPSLSNAIIGLYFYYLFLKENRNKDFWLSVLILTLAALSRTTFAIPLIAVFAVELIRILKKETDLLSKVIPVSISILVLLSYMLYNGYLRANYGSLFLNLLMPPDSFGQALELIKLVFKNWFFQYFTPIHYLVFAVVFVLFTHFLVNRKFKIQKTDSLFALLALIYLLGCFIFAFLMLKQFPAHDYYFLDTFFLPFLMVLIIAVSIIPIPEKRNIKRFSIAAIYLIFVTLILLPIKSQEKRRETGFWDRTEATINNYQGSSEFLDRLGIPRSAKILVIDAVTPNIPFILMQRKGFAVMTTNQQNIESALNWDYDYIVVQNEFFISDIYAPFPAVLSKLDKIADNGKISICTLSVNNQQSLFDFIGLNEKKSVFEKSVSFENEPDSLWRNYNPTDRYAFSGQNSGHLSQDIVYGLTYKTIDLPEITMVSRTLLFSSYFLRETDINCELVVSINSNGQNVYYKSYNLKKLIKQAGNWEQVSLIFQLPKIQADDYEFAIFIWNTGKSELYYDDFTFAIY